MNKLLSCCLLLAGGTFAFLPRAQATLIEFDLAQEDPDTYVYTYSVTNDTLAAPIEEFTTFFALNLFANLMVAGTPSGWSAFAAQPDPVLPDDGFFDALADPGFGIAPGFTLAGFAVRFDFLGPGLPGSQPFDILQVDPFEVIDSGLTVRRRTSVPEPASLGLLALGLAAMTWASRRKRGVQSRTARTSSERAS